MITKKQKDARIKNFSKGRLRGCLTTLRQVAEIENICEECRDYLKDASQLVNNTLSMWDRKA